MEQASAMEATSQGPWVCEPCKEGDHKSHDGRLRHETGPKPWSGDQSDLDLFDCKTTTPDNRKQCMCRATWPRGQ